MSSHDKMMLGKVAIITGKAFWLQTWLDVQAFSLLLSA